MGRQGRAACKSKNEQTEEGIRAAPKWTVFKANDERLWARVRREAEAVMLELFRQGTLAGHTPEEAYFVKCGGDTTTQADTKSIFIY